MASRGFNVKKEPNEANSYERSFTVGVDDKFLDPEKGPHVGEDFQANIPSLVVPPYLSRRTKMRRYSKLPESISITSRITRIWPLESAASEKGPVTKNVGRFPNFQSSCSKNSYPEVKTELHQLGSKALLPGLLVPPSWTEMEKDSFLLSLYAFGKNFKLLKKFVGSKSAGDIMYYYYGRFYTSEEYLRWVQCRKSKTKRFVCGKKIFTGCRQQELLARLFSKVSKDSQSLLVKISTNLGLEKISFQEYVFALKDIVGVELLIAAVGIGGRGKLDLTSAAFDLKKTTCTSLPLPEIPTGKVSSSLTPAQIVKTLTASCRLSKSRASNLFWEAVWPRLLANGWHSEQSTDYVPSGSKPHLVFLMPGVKKFSIRKPVNGNHYFDSISDVLHKVASEPGLLETDILATDGSEERIKREDKQHPDGVSNKQQTCYLQPLRSKCKKDLHKFTIVDTSMVHGMDQSKVRQLRSLPFQTVSSSSESEQETSQNSEDIVELACPAYPIEDQVALDEGRATENQMAGKMSGGNSNARMLIDLNFPDVSRKLREVGKPSPMVLKQNDSLYANTSSSPNIGCSSKAPQKLPIAVGKASPMVLKINDGPRANTLSSPYVATQPSEIKKHFPDGHEGMQPSNGIRRHSSRNRPLTAKALEALELGFLNATRKRKNAAEPSASNSNSQSLQVSGGTNVSVASDKGSGNAMAGTRKEAKNVIPAYSCVIDLTSEDPYNV
ncbi:hypothetical protein RIF29_25003 [Crotalaria pallida]|uniref:SANT domain-containing protein n=1 Tax=Crotalaria pallida TaxID=3830 RepID=A0AAN9EN81_CROPI